MTMTIAEQARRVHNLRSAAEDLSTALAGQRQAFEASIASESAELDADARPRLPFVTVGSEVVATIAQDLGKALQKGEAKE